MCSFILFKNPSAFGFPTQKLEHETLTKVEISDDIMQNVANILATSSSFFLFSLRIILKILYLSLIKVGLHSLGPGRNQNLTHAQKVIQTFSFHFKSEKTQKQKHKSLITSKKLLVGVLLPESVQFQDAGMISHLTHYLVPSLDV